MIDNEFYVPVKITGEASIDFFIDKYLYYEIADQKDIPSVSDWNEYVYMAEDTDIVSMEYTLVISASSITEETFELTSEDIELSSDDIEDFLFDRMVEKNKEIRRRRRHSDL